MAAVPYPPAGGWLHSTRSTLKQEGRELGLDTAKERCLGLKVFHFG